MTMTAATQLSRAQIDECSIPKGRGREPCRARRQRSGGPSGGGLTGPRSTTSRRTSGSISSLSWGRYDGGRGTLETYIGEVVRRKARTLLRDRWAGMSGQLRIALSLDVAVASDGEGRPVTLAETLSDDDDNRRIRRSPAAERRDQVIDLEMAIAQLPEDLRPICEGLKIYSKKKVEADAHLSPWRLNRHIGEIREAFEAAGLRDYHPSSASD